MWKRVFYGTNDSHYSITACLWIESQSRKTGKHIHHAICGHGGERHIQIGKRPIKVDGFEPETNTVYQYHGCYWHGCDCNPDNFDEEKKNKTIKEDKMIKDAGFNLVSVWGHEAKITVKRAIPPKKTDELQDPNGRAIVLRENVDIAKLGYLVQYKDYYEIFDNDRELLARVEKYYQRMNEGDNTTRYVQPNQS